MLSRATPAGKFFRGDGEKFVAQKADQSPESCIWENTFPVSGRGSIRVTYLTEIPGLGGVMFRAGRILAMMTNIERRQWLHVSFWVLALMTLALVMLTSGCKKQQTTVDPKASEAAVRAAERATELGPGDPDNWVALAIAQHHAGQTQAAIEAFEKAISWSPLRPPHYAVVAARLRYSVQDYENALRFARECMGRTPALGVCKAVWLSSLIRTGHAVQAEAAWPVLVAAAPSLQAYRMTPHNTPMALSVDEDLDRLRKSDTRAIAQ